MSLNLKLLLIIVGVLAIGFLLCSLLLLDLQRRQLVESYQAAATHASKAIRSSIEHAMLTNELSMANVIVASVVSEGSIERVQVIGTQGLVWVSSDSSEVGYQYNPNQALCRACHSNVGVTAATHAIYDSAPGHSVLLTANSIPNQPQCLACHDSRTRVLGLLITETPLEELDNALAASQERIILSATLTFVLMAGLILLALHRFVIHPVKELAKGMVAVGSGDLEQRVPTTGNDELGDLAIAFDTMRQHLINSRAETNQSNRELAVLYEVALATGHLAELEQILRGVLEIVVDKLRMQTGLIYLWNEGQKRFERILSRGFSSEQLQKLDRRRKVDGGDLTTEIANLGTVHYVPDMSTSSYFRGLYENLTQRSYIIVPLKSHGKVIGTLELGTLPGHKLTDREINVVKAVGYEISIAVDNSVLLTETRRSEREATTLYEMGTQISASLELDHVLNAIAKAARQVLGAEIGAIALIDVEQQTVTVQALAGAHSHALDKLRVPFRAHRYGVLTGDQPIIVERWDATLPVADGLTELVKAEGIVSVLAVPFWRTGNLRGLVGIMSRHSRHFTTEEVRLLARLAQQTGIAIENAQLYERVQYVTVLEERERIAREIHDGLVQLVGSIRIWAEEAEMSLSERNWKASHTAIKKAEETARDAYASLREEMMGLRETFIPGKDIFPILAEYLSRFQREWNIQARLNVRGEDNLSEPTLLSPSVEIQLLRIIQEGLTNVHRHSNAHHVLLDCVKSTDALSICIQDDGEGFAPESVPDGHLGLRIMRERAASVGGRINISSTLGQGTRLEIIIPRNGTQSCQRSNL